jgi:hypothetical protein
VPVRKQNEPQQQNRHMKNKKMAATTSAAF